MSKSVIVHYAPAAAMGNGESPCNRFMNDSVLVTRTRSDVTCKKCLAHIRKKQHDDITFNMHHGY